MQSGPGLLTRLLATLIAAAVAASGCSAGTSAPTATPEFTALVKSTAETGGRFGDSAAVLAGSYQQYLSLKTPQNIAEINALITSLTALQRDMTAYGKDVESAIHLTRQLAAEQQKTVSLLPGVTAASAQGLDDAADLAIQTEQGLTDSARVQACYDEIIRLGGINYLTTSAGAKKKDECDAMHDALQKELARRGVGTLVGSTAGVFASAATGAGLAAGGFFAAGAAPIAAGAIVVVGAGYATSSLVGILWDYCTGAPSTSAKPSIRLESFQVQTAPQQCAIAAGHGRPGTRIVMPSIGKGTLALYYPGKAPLIVSNVTVAQGQDTTVDGNPPNIEKANPTDMAHASTVVKQSAGPAGGKGVATAAQATTVAAAPAAKGCWRRGPIDFASSSIAPTVYTFKATDSTFTVSDSGAVFKSSRFNRDTATAATTGTLTWSLPDQLCAGGTSFSLKQSGQFGAYPYPSLGAADSYVSASALLAQAAQFPPTSTTVGPFTANAWKITPPSGGGPFKIGLLLSGSGVYSAAAIWTYQPG